MSYISNKPYNVYVLCIVVAERLDSVLARAACLNFANFGVSFLSPGNVLREGLQCQQ